MNKAAKVIFTKCLQLSPSSEVTIFADEFTIEVAKVLLRTAYELHLLPTIVFFPHEIQETLHTFELTHIERLLQKAVAVFICLNDSGQCLQFREKLRKYSVDANCRVAHMPGIDLKLLEIAVVNQHQLSNNCELVAQAIFRAKLMEIKTFDVNGNAHLLTAHLPPEDVLPMISDGVIQPRSWGNVPSGEVFIAPSPNSVQGSIVIDGSLPKYPMPKGEQLVLWFSNGHLVDWQPRDSAAAQHLENDIIRPAQAAGDSNWSNLAEIGLGLNPAVGNLNGNPLHDEKKMGTVHIALGDNKGMGGTVLSSIHCDMVSLYPEVVLDQSMVIMKEQSFEIKDSGWHENFRNVSIPDGWSAEMRVRASVKSYKIHGNLLYRGWDTDTGRFCTIRVGDKETARYATPIYNKIVNIGTPIRIGDLTVKNNSLSQQELIQIVYMLYQYGLVITEES